MTATGWPYPLGVFGPIRGKDLRLRVETLAPLKGGLDVNTRGLVAQYLRNAAMVLAYMEYTRDLIGNNFGVSGGSAIMSDGTYYWRLDAAEYVDMYGISIDAQAVELMRERNWVPPQVEQSELKLLEELLSARFRERSATHRGGGDLP